MTMSDGRAALLDWNLWFKLAALFSHIVCCYHKAVRLVVARQAKQPAVAQHQMPEEKMRKCSLKADKMFFQIPFYVVVTKLLQRIRPPDVTLRFVGRIKTLHIFIKKGGIKKYAISIQTLLTAHIFSERRINSTTYRETTITGTSDTYRGNNANLKLANVQTNSWKVDTAALLAR